MSPQERLHHLLDQRAPKHSIITIKFKLAVGMRLVQEHVEAAAALVGIAESGLVY